jgi:hypothetical protein
MTTPRRGTVCLASKERTTRPRSGIQLFAFIVGGLGVFLQELARGPLLLEAAGGHAYENADRFRVGIDDDIRLEHGGGAEVPECRVRRMHELVRALLVRGGKRRVVSLRKPYP